MYFQTMSFLVLAVAGLRPGDGAVRVGNNNYDMNDDNVITNVDERFLKSVSHHYCDRLTGTHVVLLPENKSSVSFYKVLLRSFQSTFYVHSTLVGNFSSSDYYVLYIEDERFFFNESNYKNRFWHTTRTYLIVSKIRLKLQIIRSQIKRLWETFGVFKISLLHSDDLKVLRIFNDGFYKHVVTARKLNYGQKNVNGYPLKAVVFPRMPSIICNNSQCTGPDWITLQLFAKIMNFTLRLTMFPDQIGFGSFTNGTYTGVLAEIVYGRADVSFNSRFLNDPTKDKAYRYSNTYGLDFICFVVPRDEPLPRMQTIWKTFSLEVWLCVAVTYALMTKSFQLYNKFNLFGGRKIPDPFMTSLQVIFGMGVYSLPKNLAARLLLVSCSAACFVIVSLFQASMVTKLSIDLPKVDIETLEELDKSGMEIRTSLNSIRDSLATYSHTKSLADKINLEKDRRDFVTSKFVFTARIMSLVWHKYSNYFGQYQNNTIELHIVRECPLYYYLSYAVALDFPFLDELNDFLARVQESGLSNKWKMDIKKFEIEVYKPVLSSPKGLKAYTMNDLWFAFVILIGGYVMSTIALIFEFILKKIKN